MTTPSAASSSKVPSSSTPFDDMPPNVRAAIEQNPEAFKQLTDPNFLMKIHQATISANPEADWCIACGASRGTEPKVE